MLEKNFPFGEFGNAWGLSGFSGYTTSYSGFSGMSGISYSGYSGLSTSGFSGYSGYVGVSGYSGVNNSAGTSGFSGRSGFSGVTGFSGVSGYSGSPSGFSGKSGFSGVSGFSGGSASDIRYKRDVRPFSEGLSVLRKIRPVIYKWNGLWGGPDDDRDVVGVIGQEIEGAFPSTVYRAHERLYPGQPETETIAFDPTPILFLLINGVRELSRGIEEAKARC